MVIVGQANILFVGIQRQCIGLSLCTSYLGAYIFKHILDVIGSLCYLKVL